jgi:chromosome segregation and condensation protein ScpB
MQNIEAVIFHLSKSVSREQLAALIGEDCNLDDLIAEIREE